MLANLFGELFGRRASAKRRHAAALERAHAAYAAGRLEEARSACAEALRARPHSAEASWLAGIVACASGDADAGAAALERAVALDQDDRRYLAALADARLLQQHEDNAAALYRRAFPAMALEIDGLGDPPSPAKKAHPDWTSGLRRLTLPRAGAVHAWPPRSLEETRGSHLLNWGLLLAGRRRVRAALHVLEAALAAEPGLGYAQAVLALLYTLDQAWPRALAAGRAARSLGADAFSGATDLCIVGAQLALRLAPDTLDPLFAWTALDHADDGRHLALLPPLEGLPRWSERDSGPIYFVACDSDYLVAHAVALIQSLGAQVRRGAVHLHLYAPDARAWAALETLRARAAPLSLTVSSERVRFEDYPSKALYCACARFVRLYQAVQSTGTQFVMLDADSLVRSDPAAALARAGDIALVRAEFEPPWHRYLAGFCAFRRSEASLRYLRELAALMAANLANGRARRYFDQIALYACALRAEAAGSEIDHLPIGTFCDTLFTDEALVWSVTQNKDADSRYANYKREVLGQ